MKFRPCRFFVYQANSYNELHFFYDAANKPAVVVYNGTAYAYVKNLQGDIIAILDQSGNAVVQYAYDAWGKPIATTGSMASTLGVVNPFRYRGYVYDQESGDYYFPMLGVPATENESVGRWAHLRQEYLKEHHPVLFGQLVVNRELHDHLTSIERDVQARMDTLVRQMKKAESITEELKARDQMAWVGAMNSINARAREIILQDLIFC